MKDLQISFISSARFCFLSSSLEFEADSIILIYYIRKGKRRERFIEILKMRGTKHSNEIHALDIDGGGFSVDSEIYKGKI